MISEPASGPDEIGRALVSGILRVPCSRCRAPVGELCTGAVPGPYWTDPDPVFHQVRVDRAMRSVR